MSELGRQQASEYLAGWADIETNKRFAAAEQALLSLLAEVWDKANADGYADGQGMGPCSENPFR